MTEHPELVALRRAIRVADQQGTAYAVLRDRYMWRSRALDVTILLLSIWLVAMTFVEPRIGEALSPEIVGRELWVGLLAVGTFMLSALQLLVNWKGRAEGYARSLAGVSAFVKTYRALSRAASPDLETVNQAMAAYRAVSDSVESVPETDFLKLKQRHLMKAEISKALDSAPAACIPLLYLKRIWRDNKKALSWKEEDTSEQG